MANPRRYLGLFQTLVEMDVHQLESVLPHLDPRVREAIYVSIYSVQNSKKLSAELKEEIDALTRDKGADLQFLTGKGNSKNKKRRVLGQIGREVQVLLSAAIPLIIMSSPVKRRVQK